MINQTENFFFFQFIFKNSSQWKQVEIPTDPSKKCPKEEHFELMLISYCCSSEKVCLHLFSWPCLQWMSSSFAYLTNVPSYECTITCWCFRWKERFSGLWKCPMYRVAIFVIFPKGLTNGLSWKIEIWPLFVFFSQFFLREGGRL